MRLLISILALSIFILWGSSSEAKVYLTKDDALKKAFPDAVIERKTLFLSDDDVKRVESISGVKVESKILTYYIAMENGGVIGYAFFGSHIVRTKPEIYTTVINPDGSIKYVEILAFYEPEEYLPTKRWFDQFGGKVLDDNLWTKRGISAVTGATLSANSITQEVRKTLSVFKIMILKKGD
ncbi:MAG: FMN-binding protein [Nitrospinae bacterium]|nr:FMN-binding protein [Nitrospinota bacterium]MBI5750472.1 FMN-binding protein [Nitrospinota bacterium]